MHRYELSRAAELPPLCPCQMGYATQPTGLCKVCLDWEAQKQEAEQRQREASLRDLESAHFIGRQHGASLYTLRTTPTDQEKREAATMFVLAVAVIVAVLMVWWLIWDINEKAHRVGQRIVTYGAQGWEGKP